MLIGHEVKKMIDQFAKAGKSITDLPSAIESGAVELSALQTLQVISRAGKEMCSDPEEFTVWARRRVELYDARHS
mgnify:CR=1 FL=1